MAAFRPGEERKLVALVSQQPELFDASHRSYKNYIIRNRIWEGIAGSFGKSVPDCKSKWRNIRDTYFKIRKNLHKSGARSRSIRWHLFPQLQFLDDTEQRSVLRQRKNDTLRPGYRYVTRLPPADGIATDPLEDEDNETTRDSVGRVKNENNQEPEPPKETPHNAEDNEDIAFFRAMALIVGKLPEDMKARARMDVHKTVFRYELQAMKHHAERAERRPLAPDTETETRRVSIEQFDKMVKFEEDLEQL